MRRSRYPPGNAIVVGIGYSKAGTVENPNLFDGMSRTRDLTPLPLGKDGSKQDTKSPGEKPLTPGPPSGGSAEFLDFILDKVAPSVHAFLTSSSGPAFKELPSHNVLMGHSFGGLFALTAFLRRLDDPKFLFFDSYLAISPSLWFGDRLIFPYAEEFLKKSAAAKEDENSNSSKKPSLLIGYGTQEQYPLQFKFEADAQFQRRRDMSLHHRMTDFVLEMEALLSDCQNSNYVEVMAFSNANHGVAGSCMSSYGIPWALEQFEMVKK